MTTTQPHQDQINGQNTLWEVSDELWLRLAPILVIDKPRKKSGRPVRDARPIFTGLIWLARTGSQRSQLPRRYGPKSTVHERLCAWGEHECFRAAWAIVLEEYGQDLGIDREWQAADGSIVNAPLSNKGARVRRKPRAVTPPTEAKGLPLSVVLCGANRHDSDMLMDVLEAVVVAVPALQEQEQRPPIVGSWGRHAGVSSTGGR